MSEIVQTVPTIASSTKGRVLVADDAEDLRHLVVRLLNRTSTLEVVAQAAESQQVLDLVAAVDVDVVLLDLSMPGIGGLAVLRAITASRPDLPVVVLSGLPAGAASASCLEAGAFAYIEKGTGISSLVEIIGSAVHL